MNIDEVKKTNIQCWVSYTISLSTCIRYVWLLFSHRHALQFV